MSHTQMQIYKYLLSGEAENANNRKNFEAYISSRTSDFDKVLILCKIDYILIGIVYKWLNSNYWL
jgi:hypothetical protein